MRSSPFFDDVPQLDVEVGEYAGKLPIFYYDASATAAFSPHGSERCDG